MLRCALVIVCLSLVACGGDEEPTLGADTGTPDADVFSDADGSLPDMDADADSGAEDVDAGVDIDTDPDAAVPDADAVVEPGPALEVVCETLSASTCAGVFACECPTESVLGYTSEADCVEQRTAECLENWAPEARTAFADGTLFWIAENVEACVAGRDAQFENCTFDENVGDARCSVVFSERTPVGEPCLYGGFAPCAAGEGYCNEEGTCTAKQGEGESCDGPRACAVGLACPDSTCVTPVPEGGACTSPVECEAGLQCLESRCSSGRLADARCESPLDCAAGLSCVAGTCADVGPVGTPCNDASECNRGLACLYNPGARTCTAGREAGDACSFESPCAVGLFCGGDNLCAPLGEATDACADSSQCTDGLVCSESVCVQPPGVGEPCLQVADAFCERGLGCNFVSGNCEAGGGEGSECLLNGLFGYACSEGFGCNFEESGSFCRGRSAVGGPCTNDSTCVEGSFCNYEFNSCEALRGVDAPCPSSNECSEGLLCEQVGDSMRCITPPGAGDTCYNLCDEGLTCSGIGGLCGSSVCTTR